jgi:THO complex subunit 5
MVDVFPELDRVKGLCEQIRGGTAKGENGAATAAELVLMDMKGASREVHLSIEATKKLSDTEKANFDSKSLQLHNLLYEKHHYQREIERCKDFRSRSDDVELVDVEAFASAAPPELQRAGDPAEPHQLMVDRLDFELLERQRLSREESVLVARRSELAATVRAKAAFLNELPTHLQAMRASSAALEQTFKTPVSVVRQQHSAARSLPAPLYVVFAQLEAYRDTADEAVSVTISGHVADAEAWYKVRNESVSVDAAEEDEQEGEEERQSKRAKVEDSDATVRVDEDGAAEDADDANDDEEEETRPLVAAKQSDMFPLVVTALVPIGDAGSIRILFSYAPSITAVLADAELVSTGGIADSELCGSRLLSTLYRDDGGLVVPEHSSEGAGRAADLRWDPSQRARPYRWAQYIAGVPVAGTDSSSDTDQRAAWQAASANGEAHARAVRSVFERVAARAEAQVALRRQLRALAEHELQPSVDMLLVPRSQDMVKLTRWEPTAATQDTGDADSLCFVAAWDCDPGSLCQKGQLVATVEVPPDYPVRAPTFRLSFTKCPAVMPQGGSQSTTGAGAADAANDSTNALRQIEAEVNARYSQTQADDSGRLLSRQVGRLMCCLAVYAATLSAAATDMPTLFCSKPHRGRGRSHAFAFDTQQQQFV